MILSAWARRVTRLFCVYCDGPSVTLFPYRIHVWWSSCSVCLCALGYRNGFQTNGPTRPQCEPWRAIWLHYRAPVILTIILSIAHKNADNHDHLREDQRRCAKRNHHRASFQKKYPLTPLRKDHSSSFLFVTWIILIRSRSLHSVRRESCFKLNTRWMLSIRGRCRLESLVRWFDGNDIQQQTV